MLYNASVVMVGTWSKRVSIDFYLTGSMIDDEIHDELHVAQLQLLDKTVYILHCTVWGMDIAIVGLRPG